MLGRGVSVIAAHAAGRRRGSGRESDLSDLSVVGWRTIKDFLTDTDGLSFTEKDRQADAAKLIAKVVIERSPRFALRVEAVNFLGKTAIWGAAGLVGYEAGPALRSEERRVGKEGRSR